MNIKTDLPKDQILFSKIMDFQKILLHFRNNLVKKFSIIENLRRKSVLIIKSTQGESNVRALNGSFAPICHALQKEVSLRIVCGFVDINEKHAITILHQAIIQCAISSASLN